MARPHAKVILLSDEERTELQRRTRSLKIPLRDAQRAHIILLACQGLTNQQIAAKLNCRRNVIIKWRSRFAKDRFAGLNDLPRSGRPRTFSPSAGNSHQEDSLLSA